jgi:phenylacetate-CoA ligase
VPLVQRKPPFWRYNSPGRQILFSAYHMSPDNLAAYVTELRQKRPPWLHGYPSVLALMAAFMVDKNIDCGYSVRWITTGAENLLPQQAAAIERAFGVRPVQHYGMAEAVANASECEQGRLHVDEDFAAVEFLPNDSSDSCRVVGTNFTNPATPLLRYEVQDLAVPAIEICPCGRAGRVVTRLDGRKEDYVVLKNGARLGRMDHIFKDAVHIREAQIYQRQQGEITIRIVRSNQYTREDEVQLLNEMQKRVGELADISFEYVEKLERSATGKLRLIISEIPEGQVETVSR